MGFAVIFLIGAAIQTSAQHSLGQIYGGRVIAGLGGTYILINIIIFTRSLLVVPEANQLSNSETSASVPAIRLHGFLYNLTSQYTC